MHCILHDMAPAQAKNNGLTKAPTRGITLAALALAFTLSLSLLVSAVTQARADNPVLASGQPILIGLDADMSGPSAEAGVAIQRGALIAMAEINHAGGVLGRPLELVTKDHRGNPARGRDHMIDFAAMTDLVAVLGGKHTPVALYQMEIAQNEKLPFIIPWAAGTSIIENGFDPNYIFRVSVRDDDAGGFLVDQALARGFKRPFVILANNPWGRSNDRAITKALTKRNITPTGFAWVNQNEDNFLAIFEQIATSRSDVVLAVLGSSESVSLVKTLASLPEAVRPPVISHWAVSGGAFFKKTRDDLAAVDLTFLQTYSFLDPVFPDRAERVIRAYNQMFGAPAGGRSLFAPVGTAHSYDAVHMLAEAINRAGSLEGPVIRQALLDIKKFKGLVRNYAPPFRVGHQDALGVEDFRLGRFADDGAIEPLPRSNGAQ